MDEAEWNSCTDPSKMLKWLRRQDKLSERKLRLFAVACCRRVWPLLTDERSRRAVEVAERYADGQASEEELTTAGTAAWDAAREQMRLSLESAGVFGAAARTTWLPEVDFYAFWQASVLLSEIRTILAAEQGDLLCAMLRDLVGPTPFRPLTIAKPLLGWNSECVVRLTQVIYEERRFEELSILADALQEAGCEDDDIIGHLRGPGPHVRGCFALDLLLDRQ